MIRVIVADDSALMRRHISDILNSDKEIEVVDTAKTGMEAIKKVIQLKPDVVTLDLALPDIDGLTALNYIMTECPTPVVILSAHVEAGSLNALKASELGAVAMIEKPSGEISLDIDIVEKQIIEKVKYAATVDVKRIRAFINKISAQPVLPDTKPKKLATELKKVVAIGSSTGGPKAIKEILPYFPADVPAAFLLVQHMPASFTKSMSQRLNWMTKIRIKEAEEGDIITPGWGYLAPGDYHMIVKAKGDEAVIGLTRDPPVHCVRPSVTVMMNSAVEVFGPRLIGVLLTGMGGDGVEGMRKIKEAGGKTLAEDESTCVVFGMPKVAIQEGVVDKVVPLPHMGIEIMKMIES